MKASSKSMAMVQLLKGLLTGDHLLAVLALRETKPKNYFLTDEEWARKVLQELLNCAPGDLQPLVEDLMAASKEGLSEDSRASVRTRLVVVDSKLIQEVEKIAKKADQPLGTLLEEALNEYIEDRRPYYLQDES